MQEETLILVFGDPSGEHIAFGPLTPTAPDAVTGETFGFFDCPITLRRVTEPVVRLREGNGLEALALSHLREDLRKLLQHRRGTLRFGDHDYGDMVEMAADTDEAIRIRVDLPSEDLWDVRLPSMTMEDVVRLLRTIDSLEEEFGPLLSHCQCGAPSATYALHVDG